MIKDDLLLDNINHLDVFLSEKYIEKFLKIITSSFDDKSKNSPWESDAMKQDVINIILDKVIGKGIEIPENEQKV